MTSRSVRGTQVLRTISHSLAIMALWSATAFRARAEEPLANRPAIRRPVAAAVLADGQTLAVANERSGSLSLVDLATGHVRGEYPVGEKLADFTLAANGRHALAVDEAQHALLALDVSPEGVAMVGRCPLPYQPTTVRLAPDGHWASIASTWSHQVQFAAITWPAPGQSAAKLELAQSLALPFAPRLQLFLPGARLLVADAFGGHLALVDTAAARVLATHELEAQNIRGLALAAAGQEVLLTHQIVDEVSPTSLELIERGTFMRNVLRRIPLAELERTQPPLNERSAVRDFGMPEHGTADPAGIVPLAENRIAVAFAGVHEVELCAADRSAPNSAVTLPVGRRPTQLIRFGASGLAVLNTFDDSVSLLDLTEPRVTRTIALGPMAPLAPQDRGELLFFDGRLSHFGWLSCHSCHSEGHTTGRNADTLGDGTYGTPKRTPSLLGTGLTYRWAWNGSQQNLYDQIEKSLDQTMHAEQYASDVVGDLTAYLIWLKPPPPRLPATDNPADRAQIARGRAVFAAHECADCHIPPLVYTSNDVYDVGLADEKGLRKFNPPSLRGVGQGYRFLHDGRAGSLEEVFRVVGHPHNDPLTGPELDDLLRFLNSL